MPSAAWARASATAPCQAMTEPRTSPLDLSLGLRGAVIHNRPSLRLRRAARRTTAAGSFTDPLRFQST
jgi:hypothetical protein